MVFEFGKPISKLLSDYLIQYTNQEDLKQIAELNWVDPFLLWSVVHRVGPMERKFENQILTLMKLAIKNSEEDVHRAVKAQKDLSEVS